MNIVVVGSLNMDLMVRIPKIPKPGETLLGGEFNTFPRGKSANQAVAAARLGAHVVMVGCVGDDTFGWEMQKELSQEGIDTTHIFVHPEISTGGALIEVDQHAQNSMAVDPGANFCLISSDVEKARQAIGKFDGMVMRLDPPLETIYSAAQIESCKGAKVILNPAPAQVLKNDLLQMVDYLIPNEFGIATISEMPFQTKADSHRAAEKLISQGEKNPIVTLGNRGSVYYDGKTNKSVTFPAWMVQAVDTTAAGDCFVGTLAVGLCDGGSISPAVEFATAGVAISATRVGAQPSLPSYTEVSHLMKERNLVL